MVRRYIFIFIFALCACSLFAEQDTLYNDFHIDEVEVTARALTKDVIVPQTLKGEELHRLNALSVADALRYFSGVQLKVKFIVKSLATSNCEAAEEVLGFGEPFEVERVANAPS